MVQGLLPREEIRADGVTVVILGSAVHVAAGFSHLRDASWNLLSELSSTGTLLGQWRQDAHAGHYSEVDTEAYNSADGVSEDRTLMRSQKQQQWPGQSKDLALAQQIQAQGVLAMVPHVVAGAACRTFAQAVIHPLDTIKTRLQVRLPIPQLQHWHQQVASTATKVRVLSTNLQVRNYIGAAGVKDVYLGLSGAVVGMLPTSLVFFWTKEVCGRWMEDNLSWTRGSLKNHFAASTAAATASAFIKVPADVLKHRVQAYVYPNVMEAARCIVRRQGVSGLYAGFGATLLRDVPEMAIQFTVYEQLTAYLRGRVHRKSQGTSNSSPLDSDCLQHLVVGGAAGAAAAFATTPLDVLKTQMQCGGPGEACSLSRILQQKGLHGLFAGLGPRVLQTTVMSAIFFASFELCKAQLNRTKGQSLAWEVHVTPLKE